jgi:hypothetical protein
VPRAFKQALGVLKQAQRTANARRSPSGFDFALADRIAFLNAGDWDAATGNASIFLQRRYLQTLERYAPENIQMRYALAYAQGQPVAALVVQRAKVEWHRLPKGSGGKNAPPRLGRGLEERMLVCGNLLAPGPGVAISPGVQESESVWLAVGEALYRLRRADKLLGESSLIMLKDLPADGALAQSALRLLGYRAVETEPEMVLAIDPRWKSFADYLASLTSDYRSAATKLGRDLVKGGAEVRMLSAAQVSEHAEVLQRLYLNVHERQALRLATLAPDYLPALAREFGDKFRCRSVWRDGRCVGFITSVSGGEEAVGYYVGYDEQANESLPVYLYLLQSTIEDAIEFGARHLALGRTALAPKAKLGCLPQPVVCLVRHRVEAMNPLLSAMFSRVQPAQPPVRSPFKKSKGESG